MTGIYLEAYNILHRQADQLDYRESESDGFRYK